MVFIFEFRVRLALHKDRAMGELLNEGDKSVMSSEARDLANLINRREDERRNQQEFQLHRAKIIKAKAPEIWREFIEILERERDTFNETLANSNNSKYAIEYIGVATGQGQFSKKVVRGNHPPVTLTVRLEPEGCVFTIECVKHPNDRNSSKDTSRPRIWSIHVDDEDNLQIRGKDGAVSLNDLAVDVLKYFVPQI